MMNWNQNILKYRQKEINNFSVSNKKLQLDKFGSEFC